MAPGRRYPLSVRATPPPSPEGGRPAAVGEVDAGSRPRWGLGDVWVGLSKGGETAEVVFLASIAAKRGAKVLAITEQPESSLGRLADLVLQVTVPEGVDPFGMVATGSSLFTSAFCDAICVALLELRGYGAGDFAETHPGGAVGHMIREAEGE